MTQPTTFQGLPVTGVHSDGRLILSGYSWSEAYSVEPVTVLLKQEDMAASLEGAEAFNRFCYIPRVGTIPLERLPLRVAATYEDAQRLAKEALADYRQAMDNALAVYEQNVCKPAP